MKIMQKQQLKKIPVAVNWGDVVNRDLFDCVVQRRWQ